MGIFKGRLLGGFGFMIGGFRSIHPAAGFTYYGGIITLTMLFFHPLFLLLSVLLSIVLNMQMDGGKGLKRWGLWYAVSGVAVVIVNPLVSHRGSHILFYFMDNPITLEAILYGITMMLSIQTVFLSMLTFNLVITPSRFLYLFASAAPKSAMLAMMSSRFVPLLKRRMGQVALVQKAQGMDVFAGRRMIRIGNGMKQLKMVLTWSLEEALQTADSMLARGYGAGPRSTYNPFVWGRRDRVVLVAAIALLACCLWGWLIGAAKLVIYPMLEWHPVGVKDVGLYVGFTLYFLLPIGLEWRERLKWRSSTSNS